MFFTEKKLGQRMQEIAQYRLCDVLQAGQLAVCFDRDGRNGALPPNDDADWQPCAIDDQWREKDVYVWLRIDQTFPPEWRGRRIVGQFNFGLGNQRRDFEALLFIGREPWHGLDHNHQWVELPDSLAGTRQRLYCRIWSGVLEGKIRQHFEAFSVGNAIQTLAFGWRHPGCDDLWYTSLAVMQSVAALDSNSAERALMLNQANAAYNLLDWSDPGSAAFYDSVDRAAAALRAGVLSAQKRHPVTIHAVGHTHIDVAFLWQLKHTREKCARSFSTVLRLMERYPDYRFFQSQPQLYDWLKQDYPQLYQQIRQRIREGRWEIDGAMWVEADCNMPSGESLVRQILYGRRFMQQEFGVTPRCLWLPDVFGYSWALPQILSKSGIDYFMTTKISWNEFNQMPHDTFVWRGIDGSEVLAHFVTTPEAGFPRYTYNGMVNADSLIGLWDNYRDKELNQTLMLAYGYGDGGGGPNEEMLELLNRFEQMPGMPQVQDGGVIEYFTGLRERLDSSDAWLHVWDGELYFESHRGTYTSQAQVKRANRQGEIALRRLEWLMTLSLLQAGRWRDYPQPQLLAAWTLLLRNQFHDIIPGSSIAEVYRDAAQEYQQLAEQLNALEQLALGELLQNDAHSVTLFNSAPWRRAPDLAFIPGDGPGGWRDAHGQALHAQSVDGGWLVSVDLPALSAVSLRRDPALLPGTEENFTYRANGLTSPRYNIEWNEHGQLTRIYDRQHQREILADSGNALTVYEDKPLKYDAWDIEIFYIQKQRPVTRLVSAELTACGPLMAEVTFVWHYRQSKIEQRMRLYRDCPRIDFITNIQWQEYNQLLKTLFPVAIRATEATYDIQYGNVKRPTTWNTSWEYARFESVAHQWVDLAEYGYGVSLLNDCKYGHAIKDNMMQLTLVKSAVSPDPHADRGHHRFTYALLPHAGDWQHAAVAQQAWFLNEPLWVQPGALTRLPPQPVRFTHPFIQLDAVKKAEQGEAIIVRLHEFAGGRQQLTLRSDYVLTGWSECDLMEQQGETYPIIDGKIELSFKAYEIKTIKLFLQ